MKHQPVPVSKELHDTDETTRWRCAGCSQPLPDAQVPLEECTAPSLFSDDASNSSVAPVEGTPTFGGSQR